MIRKMTSILAVALLAGGLLATGAEARTGGGGGHGVPSARGAIPERSVITGDPALFGPPQQPQRSFVGPPPALGTPMPRVAPVAPLATPPLR